MSDPNQRFVPSGLVDFPAAGLPEYKSCYAIVLDSLFTREELTAFLAEAESSGPWQIAQINAGDYAFTDTSYRKGDRLIYDSFELSEKIFARMRPFLGAIEEIEMPAYIRGREMTRARQKWRMVRLNERLRYLRYPVGGFFKEHADGTYVCQETKQRTFFTLQFYLPSNASGSDESFLPPQGGSTRFLSLDDDRDDYADVEARPGRALIFQHADLLHTGELVTGGVKVTVRSDILYEKVGEPVPLDD
ncbi:hypothetical protein FB45DRAFT_924650 [Roridomyces roridus]|uniref:Prolyl 4-hydroxylase alpha subunit domain-containing protein n=1 Tax=Roridomyces roridus TaxID=1738132 RepID=A0AAD7FKG7_9AGAR|nr:hypothetical protein FB45DRAFT_957619 [Roridomyces roridus]KAJ7624952.1 hypothetical protein FB45DRAFT_924650 [Roridomyces roridus]